MTTPCRRTAISNAAAPSRPAPASRGAAGALPPPPVEAQVRFLTELRGLLEGGPFTTSYPYALVHALADLAVRDGTHSGDPLRLSVRAIAERFVEMYWPQVAPGSGGGDSDVLVQNTGRRGGRRRRAAVVRKVLEARREHGSMAALRADGAAWERLVTNVYRTVRAGPLLDLQPTGGPHGDGSHALLYPNRVEGRGRRATITLEPGVSFFLRSFRPRVLGLVRGGWTRFVRELNPAFPGDPDELGNLLFGAPGPPPAAVRDALLEAQHQRCLYCDARLEDAARVDRFIPWRRYSVELGHNLVAAHEECIRAKGDDLAAEPHLARWVQRNRRWGRELEEAFRAHGVPHAREPSLAVTSWAYRQLEDDAGLAWVEGTERARLARGWRTALGGTGAVPRDRLRSGSAPQKPSGTPSEPPVRSAVPPAAAGKDAWLRELVNERSEELDAAIAEASAGRIERPIEWRSPLAGDDFARYSGQGFLERLGVTLPERSLDSFWPRHGPQWDALGVDAAGASILVEANAGVRDLLSAPKAEGVAEARIRAALEEVTDHLGVSSRMDWSRTFYEYTSRLAHLHLLRELNGLDAWLVLVFFARDGSPGGPPAREEWQRTLTEMHRALGLTHLRLPERRVEVFLEV